MTDMQQFCQLPPWAHQVEAFELSKDAKNYALFMEPRCGKSLVVLATANRNYQRGMIDALLIVAWPSGVHRNWITDEVPTHLPSSVPRATLTYQAGRAATKSFEKQFSDLIAFKGLSILSINAEALYTATCKKYLARFLKARKVLFVADESNWAKTPGSRRSKIGRLIARHPNVIMRRILDGTPVGEGPLDLYSQMALLDPAILGFTSFLAFKHRYGVWEKGYNGNTNTEFETIACDKNGEPVYQNLEELNNKLAPHSYRVTFRAAFPDAKEKIYQKRYFSLSKTQRQAYNKLRDEFSIELQKTEFKISMALTRMLRLQQIASNFTPSITLPEICAACEGEGCAACDMIGARAYTLPSEPVDTESNPRLEALKQELLSVRGQAILWARFKHDVDIILDMCHSLSNGRSVRYDGMSSDDEKSAARTAFQSGDAQFLVGNPAAGQRGIRLDSASTMIYYSNDFSLLKRQQSEDRGQSGERDGALQIIDLVAEDTVDETIIKALRSKRKVADLIMKDAPSKWL